MQQPNTTVNDAHLSSRLAEIAALLTTDPAAAAQRASEILDELPGQPQALLLVVSALRLTQQMDVARELLEWMSDNLPKLAAIQYELGLLFGQAGEHQKAITCLARVVELEPNHPSAWRALGNQYAHAGETDAAANAYARQVRVSVIELRLLEDAGAAKAEELEKALKMLRSSIAVNPTDVSLIFAFGSICNRLERFQDAENSFERALKLVPSYAAARKGLAIALAQEMRWDRSNEQLDILIRDHPENGQLQMLKAANLVTLSRYEEALALFEKIRDLEATDPTYWVNYGHALRTLGKPQDAIAAYRKAVAVSVGNGAAWYSLANMKTYPISDEDLGTVLEQAQRTDISEGQVCLLHFALGEAFESRKDYEQSFEHYRTANELRRPYVRYDADHEKKQIENLKEIFTRDFIRSREGHGCQSPDPIFIVGMVRAGSTLIEQILSSHSMVEGTIELPDLPEIVIDLVKRSAPDRYPQSLSKFGNDEWAKRGERYLETSRKQRKLGRPLFTDKAGINYLNVALIHLILPNARIIDARRHPMACGFSGYKQAFPANSSTYSYDLLDIASNYRGYVDVMAHFDAVLPGKVHRVIHENLLVDTEGEIRRMLEFCGLPFEESCLRFYETDRGVHTISSEQVRQPIMKKSVETWQHYEPWLGELKAALGDVLTLYPEVPKYR